MEQSKRAVQSATNMRGAAAAGMSSVLRAPYIVCMHSVLRNVRAFLAYHQKRDASRGLPCHGCRLGGVVVRVPPAGSSRRVVLCTAPYCHYRRYCCSIALMRICTSPGTCTPTTAGNAYSQTLASIPLEGCCECK